jgi:hypothetical protein
MIDTITTYNSALALASPTLCLRVLFVLVFSQQCLLETYLLFSVVSPIAVFIRCTISVYWMIPVAIRFHLRILTVQPENYLGLLRVASADALGPKTRASLLLSVMITMGQTVFSDKQSLYNCFVFFEF